MEINVHPLKVLSETPTAYDRKSVDINVHRPKGSMGKFTVYGSPQFEQRVECELQQVVAAVCDLSHAPHIEAIILLGGYGRGEGTPLQLDGQEQPFNDYDLMVVCSSISNRRRKQFQEILWGLERELTEQLGIVVDLYLHTTHSLKNAEASLMNYEMLYGHQVLYGREDILSLMPTYTLEKLALAEGTRLLLNRGKLLLDVKVGLGGDTFLSEELRFKFQKFIWKNHLAFGDCVLLANGDYDLSYVVKAKRIETYLNDSNIPDAAWMVERYQRAVEFKLKGDPALLNAEDLFHAFSDTVRYYLGFLLWYEGKRLGTSLPSLQTYCNQLTRYPKGSEGWLKAFLLNIRDVGAGLFGPTWSWSFVHPRNRLYPALWLLLSFESSMALDLGLVQHLLNGDRDYNKLLKRFYELRARLA